MKQIRLIRSHLGSASVEVRRPRPQTTRGTIDSRAKQPPLGCRQVPTFPAQMPCALGRQHLEQVTRVLVRYCVQRASVLPNTPLSSMIKGSFVVAPRVLAKLELAAGLRRGHRSRQAAQDCGVIHCAGLPPPLCGAVTSPLSRDESA